MSIFEPHGLPGLPLADDDMPDMEATPLLPEPKNPSVFPAMIVDQDRLRLGLSIEVGGGLKLRDYFAAHVIGGLAAQPGIRVTSPERLADTAYAIADAMQAHRQRPAGQEAAMQPANDLVDLARQVANTRQAQRDYFAVAARWGKTHPESVDLCDVAKGMERRLDQRVKAVLDAAAPTPSLFADRMQSQQLPD